MLRAGIFLFGLMPRVRIITIIGRYPVPCTRELLLNKLISLRRSNSLPLLGIITYTEANIIIPTSFTGSVKTDIVYTARMCLHSWKNGKGSTGADQKIRKSYIYGWKTENAFRGERDTN